MRNAFVISWWPWCWEISKLLWFATTFSVAEKSRRKECFLWKIGLNNFFKSTTGFIVNVNPPHLRVACWVHETIISCALIVQAAAKTWRIVGNWLNSYHAWGSLGLMLMANWIETFLMLYVLPCLLRSKDEKSPATTKLALPEEETELNDAWNVPILFMTHVEGEG